MVWEAEGSRVGEVYSEIFAMISASRKMWYSCTPLPSISTRSGSLGRTRATHLLADLDGHTSEPRQDDTVTLLDADGDDLSVLSWRTGADCEDGTFGRRGLRCGRGEEQARGGLLRATRTDELAR